METINSFALLRGGFMTKEKWLLLGIGAVAICAVAICGAVLAVNQSNKTAKLATEWLNETTNSILMCDGYRMTVEALPEQTDVILEKLKEVEIGRRIKYQMAPTGGSLCFDLNYSSKTLSYAFQSTGEENTWVMIFVNDKQPSSCYLVPEKTDDENRISFSTNNHPLPTCYAVSKADYNKMNELIKQLVSDAMENQK